MHHHQQTCTCFCALTLRHVSFSQSLNFTVLRVILSVSCKLHSDCFTTPPQNKVMTCLHEGVTDERELRAGSWFTLRRLSAVALQSALYSG
jgi:hypothetical protein